MNLKKTFKKIDKTLDEYKFGIEIGVFVILLSELLIYLRYSQFSVDIMMVEIFAIIFFLFIFRTYLVEKNKKKKILYIAGYILLFLIIAFQFLAEYLIG